MLIRVDTRTLEIRSQLESCQNPGPGRKVFINWVNRHGKAVIVGDSRSIEEVASLGKKIAPKGKAEYFPTRQLAYEIAREWGSIDNSPYSPNVWY